MKKLILTVSAIICAATSADAQFYNDGCESAFVRWRALPTANYTIIYPEGLDSISKVYARHLESQVTLDEDRLGFRPTEFQKKRMPVVLHPYAGYANGMVASMPRRMSLFTCPNAYSPEPTPWEQHLTIHESRHVAQGEYVRSPKFRWTSLLTGEIIGGGLQSLYCGQSFFEGDAVCAETALTAGGRGRSADFLEYFRAAFPEGDTRDFWMWRYGAFGKYSPDYYKVGYFSIAGIRALYDADFVKRYYANLCGDPLPLPVNVRGRTIRESTGGSNLSQTWDNVSAYASRQWTKECASKGELSEMTPITAQGRYFEQYTSVVAGGDCLYAIKKGIRRTSTLVRIGPDGKEKELRSFGSLTSGLKFGEGLLWWSEYVPGVTFAEKTASSDVFCCDTAGRQVRRLTRGGHFFNPVPCADNILASEYPSSGGTRLVVLDKASGMYVHTYAAPDGCQVVESVTDGGGRIYVSLLTDDGFSICSPLDWKPIYGPVNAKICDLTATNDGIAFTCDRSGVHECYTLRADGTVSRITNTAQGVKTPAFIGDTLFATSLTKDGRMIYRVATGCYPADSDHRFMLAEAIAAQRETPSPAADSLRTGQPVRYHRLSNAFRFHSWLPVYFDYDALSDISFESLYQSVSLGATAYTQNDLATLSGMAGYSATPSSDGWTHAAHIKLTYTGLPVTLEASAEISSEQAGMYFLRDSVVEGRNVTMREFAPVARPYAEGSLRAYVPLTFSSGGWQRGIIPEATLSVSDYTFRHADGHETPVGRYVASVRGYAMKSVAQDAIFPRWGIGGQVGVSGRAGLADLYPSSAFALLYGYFPGFSAIQGFRFYALGTSYVAPVAGKFPNPYISCLPRGLSASAEASQLFNVSDCSAKAYLEYAIPCCAINSSALSPFFYIRNLELIPRVEAAAVKPHGAGVQYFLSAGLSASVVLSNFLCVAYETRAGFVFDYNFMGPSRYYFGPSFSINL